MKLLLQRVRQGCVRVDGEEVGRVGRGLVVFVGFGMDDGPALVTSRAWQGMVHKMVNLRVFPGEQGHCDHSLLEAGAGILLVSQFTLYADCRKGRRPSFSCAARPEIADPLFHRLAQDLADLCPHVATGRFGADMDVELVNWGPVTLLLDSRELFPGSAHEGKTA
ncbi:MAG: D-tyrosyl-tRNA(Tyr) deacylase [Deltaproteobacteria bacterium]|nr:MAG: D-tyrosyl-tRNA(Tyr) deacylase [Deltaproteobacteria bacterium]